MLGNAQRYEVYDKAVREADKLVQVLFRRYY